MTTREADFSSIHVSGKMFLYERPELLTQEEHGDLGFTPPPRPHEHVRSAKAIPLTMVEFGSAQRHYPIVFTNIEKPVPLAVVSVLDEDNLFVDADGVWDEMCYLPSYLRCYPFTLVKQNQDRMAVVFDRTAAAVSDRPEYPFFVDGKPSDETEQLMKFCAQHNIERARTEEFCDHLKRLDLLAPYRSTHQSPESEEPLPLADYLSVNVEKLNDLPEADVYELHKSGRLVHIYMQIYSIENFRHLMARRESRRRKQSAS